LTNLGSIIPLKAERSQPLRGRRTSNLPKGLLRETRRNTDLQENHRAKVKNRVRQAEKSRSPKNRDLRGEKWKDPRTGGLSGSGKVPRERRSLIKRKLIHQKTQYGGEARQAASCERPFAGDRKKGRIVS
jgi:hypothetical protein